MPNPSKPTYSTSLALPNISAQAIIEEEEDETDDGEEDGEEEERGEEIGPVEIGRCEGVQIWNISLTPRFQNNDIYEEKDARLYEGGSVEKTVQ